MHGYADPMHGGILMNATTSTLIQQKETHACTTNYDDNNFVPWFTAYTFAHETYNPLE